MTSFYLSQLFKGPMSNQIQAHSEDLPVGAPTYEFGGDTVQLLAQCTYLLHRNETSRIGRCKNMNVSALPLNTPLVLRDNLKTKNKDTNREAISFVIEVRSTWDAGACSGGKAPGSQKGCSTC